MPVPEEYKEKERELNAIICDNRQLSVEELRSYAMSPGGFITGKSKLIRKILS